MTSTSDPGHLSGRHRHTLGTIFQHPTSHNLEWHDVLSLLESVGSVTEHGGGGVAVTVGSETAFFDVPMDKDVDVDTMVSLRRLLADAGYEAGHPEGQDRTN